MPAVNEKAEALDALGPLDSRGKRGLGQDVWYSGSSRGSFARRFFSRSGRTSSFATATALRRFISGKVAGRRDNIKPSEEVDPEAAAARTAAEALGRSGRLITAEDRATGSVPWSIYGKYCSKVGLGRVAAIAALLLGGQAVFLFSEYWLAMWASKTEEVQAKTYWIWGYGCMAAGILTVSVIRSLLFFSSTLGASTQLHSAMASRVLRAPLSFFHANPAGRVLNRFSKDQGAVDEQLPQVAFDALQALMGVLGAFILIMVGGAGVFSCFRTWSLLFFT
jgi:ATP-binding cassette, subfamily C (CFTR/MRP), member 1